MEGDTSNVWRGANAAAPVPAVKAVAFFAMVDAAATAMAAVGGVCGGVIVNLSVRGMNEIS